MKNVKKYVNHLAAQSEKTQHFKLPQQQKVIQLMQLTAKVKHTFAGILPDEVLASLVVAACDSQQMVITTTHHTVANHLNYTNQALLSLLHQDYPALQGLTQLKFSVRGMPNAMRNPASHADFESNSLQQVKTTHTSNVSSCNFSESTRQNITQLAEDVTMDKRLATILRQLAE